MSNCETPEMTKHFSQMLTGDPVCARHNILQLVLFGQIVEIFGDGALLKEVGHGAGLDIL